MNIEKISGKNYSSNKADKSGSSSRSNRSENGGSSSVNSTAAKAKEATNLSLSGSTFKSDVGFTKMMLHNKRQDALDSIKNIRKKMNAGAYDNDKVHQQIGTSIKNDLARLQPVFQPSVSDANVNQADAGHLKKKLLENPEVKRKVALQIKKDLTNIS